MVDEAKQTVEIDNEAVDKSIEDLKRTGIFIAQNFYKIIRYTSYIGKWFANRKIIAIGIYDLPPVVGLVKGALSLYETNRELIRRNKKII